MEEDKKKILSEIGLTKGESNVYLSLLNKGTQKAGELAKDTGLNRSNIYRILERLEEKKLAFSSVLEKTKYFSITRPERVKELYEEKLSKIREKKEQVDEFVEDAEKETEAEVPESGFGVEVYEGVEEIKKVLERVLELEEGEVVYTIGKEGALSEYQGLRYWFESFIKRRAEKGIKFKAVYNWHEEARKATDEDTYVRYVDLENVGDIAELAFYRDILLVFIMKRKNPRVVLLRSKPVVNSMINYFKFLWNKGKIPEE